jgi:signal peptidase I
MEHPSEMDLPSETSVFSENHAVKCELAAAVLRSEGNLRLQVTGWSMLPAVFPGDVLVINRSKTNSLSKGDIVLVERERRLFAHRLMKRNENHRGVWTQGDAMATPDPMVPESDILGTVSYIIRNGRCIRPRKTQSVSERAIAALVRRSSLAARIVLSIQALRRTSGGQQNFGALLDTVD